MAASKCGSATATNSASVTILRITSAVLIRALSRVPRQSSPATTAMMKTAGTLTPMFVSAPFVSVGPWVSAGGRTMLTPFRNPVA